MYPQTEKVMAKTALIVCGALAREVLALKERHGWDVDVLGVASLLHNEPERIPGAVLQRIRQAREVSMTMSSLSTATAAPAGCSTGCLNKKA